VDLRRFFDFLLAGAFVTIVIVNYTNQGPTSVTAVALFWGIILGFTFIPTIVRYLSERRQEKSYSHRAFVSESRIQKIEREDEAEEALEKYDACVLEMFSGLIFIFTKDLNTISKLSSGEEEDRINKTWWYIDEPFEQNGIMKFRVTKEHSHDVYSVISRLDNILGWRQERPVGI
jgi:hypothetical protein